MKTVPLHGKKAAGRVALVDDEDYELVSQYRWYVYEKSPTATRRAIGPYAEANVGHGRTDRRTTRMHNLIMGAIGIDHENHDGLDNRRSNLRPADHRQNAANQRAQEGRSSQYKGVSWYKRRNLWRAFIKVDGKYRDLGTYTDEVEAASAYDAAARELFGEFACPNFPAGPTDAVQREWAAERERRMASVAVALEGARLEGHRQWWEHCQPATRVCTVCGEEYQSRSTRSLYCGKICANRAGQRRRTAREREGRQLRERLF